MNPLTNVKNIKKLSARELELGVDTKNSWHAQYRDSAWIYIGGLQFDLTEGDIICVFSQYGEVVNINLVRDGKTGKSRGFAFLCYEDQRSTILAVDNLNGIKLVGRIIRVDHVEEYKVPKMSEEMDEEQRRLVLEGCAPKPLPEPEPAPAPTKSPSSESSDREMKRRKVKIKKEKKSKKKRRKKEKSRKKKKRRRESSESDSDTETSSSSSSSSEDEDYGKRSRREEKHSKRRHRDHNNAAMHKMEVTVKEEKKDPGYDKYETHGESRRDRNSWKSDSQYHHTVIKTEKDQSWQSDKIRNRERDREYSRDRDRDRYREKHRDRERQESRKNNTDMRRKYEDRSRQPRPRSRERDSHRDRYRDHR